MEYDEIINSNRVVLVEFYATWCPHCQRMMPIVSNIEAKLGTKATVNQIDVEKYPDITEAERVDSYPTFIIYDDGKEQWRHSGEMDEAALLSKIESYTR